MDPTKIACKVYNSFTGKKPTYNMLTLPDTLSSTPRKLTLKIKTGEKRVVPIYCDITTYNKLEILSASLPNSNLGIMDFNEASQLSDPFSGIGDSVFGSETEVARGSLKIANIDAIFKLTGNYPALLKMRLNTTYSYVGKAQPEAYSKPVGIFSEDRTFVGCVVEDTGWSATNYLQFRLENVRIHSMSPRTKNRYYAPPSPKYSTLTAGEDGTGNIISNWRFLVKSILSKSLDGINLFIANGVIDDPETEQPFVLAEVMAGLKTCGSGANLVIKLQDTLTQFHAELLYIISQCFESIVLFKPVMCSPEGPEKYLICLDRRDNDVVGAYSVLLEEVFDKSLEDYISSFLKEKLPEDFKTWFESSNTRFIEGEIEALERIQEIMTGDNVDEEYNLRQALKVWSVPGNIPRNRNM